MYCKFSLLLFYFSILSFVSVQGQEQAITLNLEVQDTPCSNESFCVDVTVDDWTDIILLQTFIDWDPNVLTFDRVEGFNLEDLGAEDFDLTQSADGRISLDWSDRECGSSGITLEDGISIFRLCFTATGGYGDTTAIRIPQVQIDGEFFPKAFKNNTCSFDINVGVQSGGGVVSTCVRPVRIVGQQQTAFEEDLVCVDFNVSGFDDLTSMQFTMEWDPGLLKFASVIPNDDVRNLGPSSFGLPTVPNIGPGKMTVSWSFQNFSGQGISLTDGTTFFQVCFEVVGECENNAPITFVDSDELTGYEVTNTVREGVNIVFVPIDGAVDIECKPQGVRLFADCGDPVNLNDEVCVTVTSDNFNSMTALEHIIEWNASILQFKGVQDVNGTFGAVAEFDDVNAGNGVLGVNFAAPGFGIGVPANQPLYDVCFDVIGLGGDSPFNFKGSPTMIARDVNSGSNNIGVNPSNCAVQVVQPEGVTFIFEDAEGRPGEEACFNVIANNFTDVTGLNFTIGWDSRIATYSSSRLFTTLPGAQARDFDSGIQFEWTGDQVTIPNGDPFMEVCVTMVGDPEECDVEVGLVDLPIAPSAITATSNGEDVGLTDQKSELCVLFPEGFYMKIDSVFGDILDTVCVPFKVASFDGITQMQFSIEWNPANLSFVEVRNPAAGLTNFTDGNFDAFDASQGLLDIDWSDAAGGNLADSTVLFEACYFLIGPADDCYEISVDEVSPKEVNTLDGLGDILSDPGAICVQDRLIVTPVVTNVSCPGESNGEIELIVSGGNAPVGFNWDLDFPQFGSKVTNLPAGEVVVTIFDDSRPALVMRDTITVGVDGELPTADAGEPQMLMCDGPVQTAVLSGSGSEGEEFTSRWTTIGAAIITGPRDIPNVVASTQGSYIYEVTNTVTGCVARDTVEVTANQLPIANAGDDQSFTCLTPTLRLNGTSSSGNNIAFQWTALGTGQITAGEETSPTPAVNGPGDYVLEVSSPDGCRVTDTVTIVDLTLEPPVADAGPDQNLGCEGSIVTLNPIGTVGEVTYEWLDAQGNSLIINPQLTVEQEGDYILLVSDENTGCTNMDTVSIGRLIDAPQLSAIPDRMVTCTNDTVNISGSIASQSDYDFNWTALDGGTVFPRLDDSLSTTVLGAGQYQLRAFNAVSLCQDSIIVTVESDLEPPIAEAGDPGTLNCEDLFQTLNAGNSSTGAGISYIWLRGDSIAIGESIEVDVQIPGIYYLEVTDNNNGCTAKDSVEIGFDADLPQIEINSSLPAITCLVNEIDLEAVVTGSTDFAFEWVGLGDTTSILSGETTLMPTVDAPGTYQLRVTDNQTGCPAINEVVIVSEVIPPFTDAGEDQTVTCNSNEATLDGSNSASGETIRYSWSSLESGIITSSDGPQANVSGAGAYLLSVEDQASGCIGTDTVLVVADTTLPVVRFEIPAELGCTSDVVLLDASESSRGSNIFVTWTGIDNNDMAIDETIDISPFIVGVDQPGRYEVLIFNDDSQCEARDTIEVFEAAALPDVVFGDAPSEDCLNPGSQLDATQTPITGDFSADWFAIDPLNQVEEDLTNELLATAFGVGDYEVVITNTSGCEIRDTISVLPLEGTPQALVDNNQVALACGDLATIDGSGSTSGAEFETMWSVLSGNGTIANPGDLSITVNAAGTYQLVVSNSTNGCSDTTIVEVTLDTEGLAQADAGTDVFNCSTTADLSGVLPVGVMGEWLSIDEGILVNPADANTTVEGLVPGENRFVWTLSIDGCENYSTDTVSVFLEAMPNAVDDVIDLQSSQLSHPINLVSNDQLIDVSGYTFQLTSSPSLGELTDLEAGSATYNLKTINTEGTDEFSYLLCNETCPTLCDSARVTINLGTEPVSTDSISAPNGITPNGDGLNEELFFEVLNNVSPETYPDNEIIIFNRWGDIVYTQKPYLNNWTGLTDSGQELPHGTYYYILRLDVANGVIVKGDVTIIR